MPSVPLPEEYLVKKRIARLVANAAVVGDLRVW